MADIINDEEFVLLYGCSFLENLEIRYEEYERFNLIKAEIGVNEHNVLHLAECLQIPDAVLCNQGSVCGGMEASVIYFEGFHTLAGTQT